ncbi:MAG: DUF3105 domain-containing protein [Deinococcus sp.]|nr:DUF3105 domain-containing protein [Deinococcus sp.]
MAKKKQKKAQSSSPMPLFAAGAAVVVVLVVAFLITSGSKPGQFVPEHQGDHDHLGTTTNTPPGGDPPTSGPHTDLLGPWGVNQDYMPPERWLHNLEDGGVAILYSCLDCPELVSQLAALVERHRNRDRHVLMAYWPGMTPVIALRAWTRKQDLASFDQGAIERFIIAFEGIDHHQPQR